MATNGTVYSTHDDIDEASDDDSEAQESSYSPVNGSVLSKTTDRYGFTGGEQFTNPEMESIVPGHILRKREIKWLDMLENWEKWMTKKFRKVKDRCRKGIPPSIRPRAWQYLCGSKFMMEHNRGVFEGYLKQPGDPKWIDDIKKDLHRQFPFHEMFAARGGHGQEDLFRVLKAYTIHNPREGYCQAQAPIAAVLLMHMPAEQAFWCLVSLCEKYLTGYYSPGLEAIQVDGYVLFGLLKKVSNITYKHVKKQKIDPILYMTEWFMCAFTRTLPWASVLRVWDMFFCEGIKVIFRIALVIFKAVLGKSEHLAECPSLYETVEKLRNIPYHYLTEEYLVQESLKLRIDEKDMEKEHQYQIMKRKSKENKSDSKKRKQSSKSRTDNNTNAEYY